MGDQLSGGLAYVRQAARGIAARMGRCLPPSSGDWQDVEQETHANLAEELGPDYLAEIGEAIAQGPGFERTDLYGTIQRCLWRAGGALKLTPKRLSVARRTIPISCGDDPADAAAITATYLGMTVDLAEAMERLDPEEQRVWSLMCQSYKGAEISRVLGMDHRRVSEIRAMLIEKMSRVIKE